MNNIDISIIEKLGKRHQQHQSAISETKARIAKDDTYTECNAIPIADLVCKDKGWETDGRNFWESGSQKKKACFVPEGEAFLVHGGTDHLPPTKKGYSPFEYIKTSKSLNNAETFEWFKERYPEIAKKNMKPYPKEKPQRQFFSICLKDVQLEEIDWLWEGWLAKGKLSLIVGDPEVGKTWLYLAIAAAISKGDYLPGVKGGVSEGKVMIFNAEDGKGDTILPRMNAIGVNANNVFLEAGVGTDEERPEHFSLGDDLQLIEDHLATGDFRLLIFDPINSYMPKGADSHKDTDVRTALAPLAKIAERLGIAVVCVMHLNKSAGTKAMYRVIGSIGYMGLARTALFVGVHPDKSELRIVDCIKNNIGPKPPPTAYSFHDGAFSWHEDDGVSATDVLTQPSEVQGAAREEAKTFIVAKLLEGECDAKSIKDEAINGEGIALRTLERAKKELKIKSVKKEDGWYWKFPESKVANYLKQEKHGNLDNLASESQQYGIAQSKVANVMLGNLDESDTQNSHSL